MEINFTARNAEIILNECYDISNVHYRLYMFTPNTDFLDVVGEDSIIYLPKIGIQADNILTAMEDFITLVVKRKWEVKKDES